MAQWINYDSVLAQITGYGIIVKGGLDVGTPRPVKCFVEGEREKRGWYRLYELTTKTGDTLIVGSYGIWRGNDPGTQKVRIDKEALGGLDADQLAAMKARVAEDRKRAEAERHREAEAAAAKAGAWWRQCQDAGESAYLARKGLGGKLYGARISKSGNLVIPIQDGDGKTWGLQVIYSDPAIKARQGRQPPRSHRPPGGRGLRCRKPAARRPGPAPALQGLPDSGRRRRRLPHHAQHRRGGRRGRRPGGGWRMGRPRLSGRALHRQGPQGPHRFQRPPRAPRWRALRRADPDRGRARRSWVGCAAHLARGARDRGGGGQRRWQTARGRLHAPARRPGGSVRTPEAAMTA